MRRLVLHMSYFCILWTCTSKLLSFTVSWAAELFSFPHIYVQQCLLGMTVRLKLVLCVSVKEAVSVDMYIIQVMSAPVEHGKRSLHPLDFTAQHILLGRDNYLIFSCLERPESWLNNACNSCGHIVPIVLTRADSFSVWSGLKLCCWHVDLTGFLRDPTIQLVFVDKLGMWQT